MNAHTQSGGRQGRVIGRPYDDPVPSGQTYVQADEPGIRGASGLVPADKATGITVRGSVLRTSPEQSRAIPHADRGATPTGGRVDDIPSERAIKGDPGYAFPRRQRGHRKSRRGLQTSF